MTLTEKIKEIVGRHVTEVGDDPEFDELASLALGIADEIDRGDIEYSVWYEDKHCNDNHAKCPELAYKPITNIKDLNELLRHYHNVMKERTCVKMRHRGSWVTMKEFNFNEVKEEK